MADSNSEARQPRRNRQPSSEHVNEPNHAQIKSEEVAEPLQVRIDIALHIN